MNKQNHERMNRIRTTVLLGVCAILIALSSSLRAGVIAQHVGATDPTTEGWVKLDESGGGHIFTPVFNDLGTTDAWKIDTKTGGDSGDGRYDLLLSPPQVNDALTNGWSLRARARLIDVDSEGQSLQL